MLPFLQLTHKICSLFSLSFLLNELKFVIAGISGFRLVVPPKTRNFVPKRIVCTLWMDVPVQVLLSVVLELVTREYRLKD